jgi:hypothetical protein
MCRFSWIHRDDLVSLILEALSNPAYKGVYMHGLSDMRVLVGYHDGLVSFFVYKYIFLI